MDKTHNWFSDYQSIEKSIDDQFRKCQECMKTIADMKYKATYRYCPQNVRR